MKKPRIFSIASIRTVLALSLFFAAFSFSSEAEVIRPAPNFTWEGAGKATSLRAVAGQPVVLIVARNARVHAFNAQLKKLRDLYQEFASRKVIFAAAIADGPPDVRSNIPFVIATNGAQVAAQYGVNDEDFNIIIIGRDGNVDYQTSNVLPASRVRDVIINSFVEQNNRRKS